MKTFKKNPYACNLCNKDFSIPKLLVRHVNTAHESFSSSGNTKKSQPELKHKKKSHTIRKNQIELARGKVPVTTVKKTKDSMMSDPQKYAKGRDTKKIRLTYIPHPSVRFLDTFEGPEILKIFY